MGNCINKKAITVEGITIIPENKIHEINKIPNNPYEDHEGNYIWINLHTTNEDFLKKQEEGFVIALEEKKGSYNLWFRKPRTSILKTK